MGVNGGRLELLRTTAPLGFLRDAFVFIVLSSVGVSKLTPTHFPFQALFNISLDTG